MFSNMKVATKLGLGFGLVIVLLIASIFVGVSNMGRMNDKTVEITEDRFPKIDIAGNVQARTLDNGRLIRNLFLVTGEDELEKNRQKIQASRTKNAEDLAALDKMINTPKGRELFDIVKKHNDSLNLKFDTFFTLIKSDKPKALEFLLKEFAPNNVALSGAIDDFQTAQTTLMHQAGNDATEQYQSSRTLMLALGVIATLIAALMGFFITRSLTRQLGGEPDAAADIANKIAAGDLSSKFEIKAGDSSSLFYAMNAMAAAVGDLSTRADASKYQGDFRTLVQGVNDTVKNIAEPMQVTSNYIDQIAKGIIPAQITTAYQGEYLVIRNNLNGLIKMMGDLLKETDVLIQGAAVGQLDKRANAELFQGGWKQLVVGVNDTVKNIAEPMKVTSNYVDQIAKGIIPAQITTAYQGEYLVIRNNLNGLIKMMGELLSETHILIQGASVGELDKRANAELFQGGWKQLVVGVNDTVKNIAEPMKVTSGYIDQIAKGIIPAQITTDYKGEYLVIRNNLNGLVKMMGDLLSETGELIQGAADGDLDKRANAAQFQGGWNQLVVGVNQIIDGIVLPVNEAVGVLQQMEQGDMTQTVNGKYKGQLDDFKNTVNNTIAKLSQVIAEVNAAASSIASASEQVSSTAQSMSQASSEQAASVEETSASVEQMSA
ncbi:MAG: methyl-accepting chemotaxis protein, partial [Comamonadaceae bacterium]